MKKKLLILSACISLLMVCFPFTLFAEEDPESDLGFSPPSSVPVLDSYFYANYDLLPYLQSSGSNQYIDTGIKASSDLITSLKFSDLNTSYEGYLYGSRVALGNSEYAFRYVKSSGDTTGTFRFSNQSNQFILSYSPYSVYNAGFDQENAVFNGEYVHEFTTSVNNNLNIYLFAVNNNGSPGSYTLYKLYNFYIYDSVNEEYLRYYYPAKAKSGGTIGLYDAVSKTFATTGGNVPFSNPTDDKVLTFQISDFITAGLGWIGDILDFAITEPLIICFMAIGLAGAMFRWGRRLVHF